MLKCYIAYDRIDTILLFFVRRFIEVEHIHEPELLIWVGVIGLLVNLLGLCLLHSKFCSSVFNRTDWRNFYL